jgi:hypothetical protein
VFGRASALLESPATSRERRNEWQQRGHLRLVAPVVLNITEDRAESL